MESPGLVRYTAVHMPHISGPQCWCHAYPEWASLGGISLVSALGRRDYRYLWGTSNSNLQSSESSSLKSDSMSLQCRLRTFRALVWIMHGRCPISTARDNKILRYFSIGAPRHGPMENPQHPLD